MSPRLKGLLDWIATAAMIAAAAAVIWTTLRTPRQSDAPAPTIVNDPRSEPASYRPGEKFGPIDGLRLGSDRKTLVLYLRSSCAYCTQSMEFYRRLAAQPDRPTLVVMGPESEQVLRDYVNQHGVIVDHIVTVPRAALKFPGTPALALVEPDGTVQKAWVGKLSANREGEVLKTLED